MALWSKIRGTIETIFQIGLNGPQVKANGAAVEMRDATDAAFVITRGLDPVAANDYATKNYVDSGTLGGSIREVRFAIGTGASQNSATTVPASVQVISAEVQITTPYSAGATIAVGQTGSTSLLMGTTDSSPQGAGRYVSDLDQAWGATPRTILVTVGGAPGAGAGFCIVRYCTPVA